MVILKVMGERMDQEGAKVEVDERRKVQEWEGEQLE